MFVFTVMGVIIGFAADRFNRVNILSVCILVVGVALVLQGAVQEYWQLVLLRMMLAAGASGCTPLATGIISDIFPVTRRAFAIAIFNWGIYGGSGLSFPVGRGIPKMNIFDLGWRFCYYGAGVIVLILATLIKSTMKESERTNSTAELRNGKTKKQTNLSLLKVLLEPRFLLMMVCASVRHCAGLTFAYNADLYFLNYFPDAAVGWALFFITIATGCLGVTAGGWISDKLVARYGIKSRVLCLAVSQLCATLPAFGVMNLEPTFALVCLVITNCLCE
jgi:MFS family permease